MKRSLLLVLSLLSACAAGNPTPHATLVAAPPAAGGRLSGDFLTGRFAAMQSDLDFAADEFLRAQAADPTSMELRQQAFLTGLLAGRPDTRRLAEGQPENQSAQLYLAANDAVAGRWDAAETRLAALPRQGLTQLLQPLLVAWAQFGGGHADAALATLRPFIDGQRYRFVYALHGALIADLAGKNADAARYYRVAQAEYGAPTLELARMVASWQARQGHLPEAIQTLKATTELNPDTAIAFAALSARPGDRVIRRATDGMAEAYLMLAAALRQQDANDISALLLQLALNLRPDFTPARLLNADIQEVTHHPQAGLRVLVAVADDDPLIGLVRLRRAALSEMAGQTEDALHGLEQIANDYPDRAEAWAMKGDILRTHHRYPEAVAAYDQAVVRIAKPGRGDWPLFYDRGIAQERAKNWARAEADFKRALELAPDQPYVLNYLGYSWAEQGRNLIQARQMIERAVEQRPNDGAIVDSLGWAMLRQGDAVGAVKALERAVELVPEDSTVNGHLGDAYWAAGRKREALFQWRRALTLNPEPEDMAQLQAKLRESEQALGIAAAPQAAQPADATR